MVGAVSAVPLGTALERGGTMKDASDARAMTTSGRGSTVVGYNVQAAVDTTHYLIVAHKVTNATSDRAQLAPMGKQAQEATGRTVLIVLADRGYYAGR